MRVGLGSGQKKPKKKTERTRIRLEAIVISSTGSIPYADIIMVKAHIDRNDLGDM